MPKGEALMHDSRRSGGRVRSVLIATAMALTVVAVGSAHHPGVAAAAGSEAAPAAIAQRSVGWVGDSIGWQSQHDIAAQVSQTHQLSTFNSILGATVDYQMAATHDVVLGPDSPDILLVELGTNDATKVEPSQFADDIRRFLDGVTPHVECVRWFDLKRGGSPVYQGFNENADLYNAILANVLGEYPTVRLVNYSTWAQLNGPAAFDMDGVHLSRRGERQLGEFASRAVDLCETDIATRSERALTPPERA